MLVLWMASSLAFSQPSIDPASMVKAHNRVRANLNEGWPPGRGIGDTESRPQPVPSPHYTT